MRLPEASKALPQHPAGHTSAGPCHYCSDSKRTDHIRPSSHPPQRAPLHPPTLPSPPGEGSHGDSQREAVFWGGVGGGFPGAVRCGSGVSQNAALSPGSPRTVDRGGYRHGGRGPGRGKPPPRAKWYPYVPLRQPLPRPRFLEGILVRPSPAAPTPPALPGGDTRTFLSGSPHPARASRSSPAPSRGQGQSWR